MAKKKTIEEEVQDFIEDWDFKQLSRFLKDIIPLFELYDIEDEKDWIKDYVKEEDKRNVMLLRTIYLVSIIAENHASFLLRTKLRYPSFHARLEKAARDS